ncbi:MAG: preprotein translocase subunit SecE [Candidatus Limisoma sp.]|nr:preprotein translocase subunit SecE [Muribaculaceae bacterium]
MKLFNKISTYTQEVYNELVNKVSWPTRSQLVSSSVIVMVASIILSLVIFAVDQVIDLAMHGIYSI